MSQHRRRANIPSFLTRHSANNYQSEDSEKWLGEWLEKRGVRDQIVLATKYSWSYRMHMRDEVLQANYIGNHAKSLKLSVEASLRKLRTDYIDVVRRVDFSVMLIESTLTER